MMVNLLAQAATNAIDQGLPSGLPFDVRQLASEGVGRQNLQSLVDSVSQMRKTSSKLRELRERRSSVSLDEVKRLLGESLISIETTSKLSVSLGLVGNGFREASELSIDFIREGLSEYFGKEFSLRNELDGSITETRETLVLNSPNRGSGSMDDMKDFVEVAANRLDLIEKGLTALMPKQRNNGPLQGFQFDM